jgi:DDE superfamily endonuclease/Transposase
MSAYSEDLRWRIVSSVEGGMSKAKAARTFSVSLSSVKRYLQKAKRRESLAPKKRPGSAPKLGDMATKLLEEDLRERPFATLRERRDYVEALSGDLGEPLHDVERHSSDRIHQEKGGRLATERNEFLRAAWRVMVAARVAPERLVFVDECGRHTSLSPIYGYAPKGERLRLSVPRKRGKNTTLLSSMSLKGMGASLAVEGATTARVFETYVQKVLVPTLPTGQIVVSWTTSEHIDRRGSGS